MPLSKQRDSDRKSKLRAEQKVQAKGQMGLVPKSLMRRLKTLGIDPNRYLTITSVSLDDYRAQGRLLEAKLARIEWQSGGIKMLREEVATLQARLDTKSSMVDTGALQRIAKLETDLALYEAQGALETIGE